MVKNNHIFLEDAKALMRNLIPDDEDEELDQAGVIAIDWIEKMERRNEMIRELKKEHGM